MQKDSPDQDIVARAGAPICSTCGDTHMMTLHSDVGDEREVMCTRCPTPCQECRAGGNGPFCGSTPCDCPCHADAWQYKGETSLPSGALQPALDLCFEGMTLVLRAEKGLDWKNVTLPTEVVDVCDEGGRTKESATRNG